MTLTNKLAIRSSIVFATTLGLVLAVTFLLFKSHTRDLYYKKLQERAHVTAYFYFEKDEINDQSYREIDAQYRRIADESIRVYYAGTKQLYLSDKRAFTLDSTLLNDIIRTGNATFTIKKRQFAGLYYKDNQGDFIIVISGIDKAGNVQLDSLSWVLLILYLASIPVQYLLATLIARQTFRPFARLIRKVNTINTDNLHSRLAVPDGGRTEIKDLIVNFNYLLERLDTGVTNQKNFLKNASHELRTPLTVIIGDIDVALNHSQDITQYETVLKAAQKEALHLKSMLEGLLILSGLKLSDRQQMIEVRADEILWNVLEKKAIEYPDTLVSVNLELTPNEEHLLVVRANRELLFIALSNIVDNAIKFSAPKQVVVLVALADQKLMIKITDNGPGIAGNEQQSVFELFFRSEATRQVKGQGLGLYITQQILDLHDIHLHLESEVGKGTSITLLFP